MNSDLLHELEDFALKASGDRKTRVASCLIWPDGRKLFGSNHLKDNHNLTKEEIARRARPRFYDAMKCSEADVVDKAMELGMGLRGAKLYSLLFPCPRCAEKIAKTDIKHVTAQRHRTGRNGKFDNPLEASRAIFDKVGVNYDIGVADER